MMMYSLHVALTLDVKRRVLFSYQSPSSFFRIIGSISYYWLSLETSRTKPGSTLRRSRTLGEIVGAILTVFFSVLCIFIATTPENITVC